MREPSSPVNIGRHVLFTTLFGAAVLASVAAAPSHAQETASNGIYGGELLDRSSLTGNWGAARDDLAAHGFTISPSLNGFYQGPTAGNVDHTFDFGGTADVFVDVDGGKLGLWDGFGMQVHGEYNFGRTPGEIGGTTIPNNTAMTFPYQNQPGGDFTSVFFSQRFGSNVTFLAGKMNTFDLYASGHKFSGGHGTDSFWNCVFVGPPSGMVPVTMFGAIGIYKIDPVTFTAMVYDPTDALNRSGFEDPFSAGVTVRPSVDVSSNLFGLPRTDSFMVAISSEKGTDFGSLPDLSKFNTAEFKKGLITAFVTRALFGRDARTRPPPELQFATTEKSGRWWIGYSFEQTLWQSSSDPTRSWGVFGQAAESDGNPNSLKWSVLGGVGGSSPLPGRPNDNFGIGAFYYGYSNQLKQKLDPLIRLGDEYGAEMFYNMAITKWFHLEADLQVIAPAVKGELNAPPVVTPAVVNNSTVVLLGLRAQLKF
jgi:porin